jgi:hypothetical protein
MAISRDVSTDDGVRLVDDGLLLTSSGVPVAAAGRMERSSFLLCAITAWAATKGTMIQSALVEAGARRCKKKLGRRRRDAEGCGEKPTASNSGRGEKHGRRAASGKDEEWRADGGTA